MDRVESWSVQVRGVGGLALGREMGSVVVSGKGWGDIVG